MRRNYKKALAFILTLLLVFGSMGAAYAGNGPRLEMKDVPDNVTGITINFHAQETVKVGKDMVPAGDEFPLPIQMTRKGHTSQWEYGWTETEATYFVELVSIEFHVDNSLLMTFVYTSDDAGDIQRRGNKDAFITYSANGGTWYATKSQNFWWQKWDSTPTTLGSIEITKTIEGKDKGPAAQFDFYILDSQGTTIGGIVNASEHHPVTIDNLTPGAYTVKEVNIPNGYTPSVNPVPVTVVSGQTATAAFENSYQTTPPPPTTPGSIQITKTIEGKDKGPATQFDFYILDSEGTTIGGIVNASENHPATIDNLTPGAYTVKEVNIPNGYTPSDNPVPVTVVSGQTVTAAFENSYQTTPPPPTSTAAIAIVKQVASSNEGPWGDSLSITDKDVHVYYRFIVTNTGDYNFNGVSINDPYMTPSVVYPTIMPLTYSALNIGDTITTDAINFDLADVYNLWDGSNTFTNEVTVTGTYGDGQHKTATDTATVTYEPITSEAGISFIKQVALSDEGPWHDSVTVNSKNRDVYYRFIVTNTGDYNFYQVSVNDPDMVPPAVETGIIPLEIGTLDLGQTITTSAFKLHLAGVSELWDGYTYTNEATATGFYGEGQQKVDKDTAVVTYSKGTSDGDGSTHNNPTTVIQEPAPPLVEIPDIVIPEAEIPKTGGLGIMAFMALGGIITAAGATLRKK